MTTQITSVLLSYITAALWTSHDESTPAGGEPMDRNYSPEDIAPDTLARMAKDLTEFLTANAADIAKGCTRCIDAGTSQYHTHEEMAAHDFWLTRNGHGAGFWDGDWEDADGDKSRAKRLTDAAHAFGSFDLYVGDDSKIHA